MFWNNAYIDTCVPLGVETERFIMRSHGFQVVGFVDDYVGFGTPSVASHSFDALYELLQELGLTISSKK